MNFFAIGVAVLVLCAVASTVAAQEVAPMEGDTDVFVLQLPKGDQDVLPQLNEILKGKNKYKLTIGANIDPYSATTGATGGSGADWPTQFTNPLVSTPTLTSPAGPSGGALSEAEVGEIVQLCLTNAAPAKYGICKKYNITISLIGPPGGN